MGFCSVYGGNMPPELSRAVDTRREVMVIFGELPALCTTDGIFQFD